MLSVFLITSTLILESSMKTEVLEEPGYLVESDLDSKEESRGKIVIDFSCFPFLFSQFLQLSEITLNLFRTLRNWNETRNNEPHISCLLRGEKRKWILALPELTPSFLSLPSAPWRNSMDTSSFSSSHCMTKGSNHLEKKINMSPSQDISCDEQLYCSVWGWFRISNLSQFWSSMEGYTSSNVSSSSWISLSLYSYAASNILSS